MKKIISTALAAMMIMGALVAMPITSAAATATAGWGPEADGIYYVDDANDLLAFAVACNADATDTVAPCFTGEIVKLRADIDMKDVAWTQIGDFRGTLDGQGFAIKNLSMSGTTYTGMFKFLGNATIKNIKFVDCSVSATDQRTAIIAANATSNSDGLRFENVYVGGTMTGTNNMGAFIGRVEGTGRKIYINNCVSDVDMVAIQTTAAKWGSSFGGFVGNLHNDNYLEITNSAFIGSMNMPNNTVASATVGFSAGSIKLEKFVNLGNLNLSTSYGGNLIFFDNQNQFKAVTSYAAITMNDCYSTVTNGKVINGSPTGTAGTGVIGGVRGNGYDVTISYGGETVFEHKDSAIGTTLTKETGAYSKLADMNAAFKTLDNTFTPEKFAELCPALAASGKWAVTTQTVEYADGKTITKIMPASVAAMINAPIATAPNATSYLQMKNGTDGKYDVRFIGAVNVADLAAYETVGFVVVVKLNGTAIMTETVETKAVYTSIKADGVDVAAETLGADYLNVLQIAGFKAENKYDISVLSFAKRADGTVVYDYAGALDVTVQNAAVAQ